MSNVTILDVKTAHDIEELKRQAHVNFVEISQKLGIIGDVAVDYATGAAKTATSGGSSPGGSNTFNTIYLKDSSTWITRDGSGNLVFRDANAGEVTLSQIKTLLAILWTYGDALGIKMKNLAGTEMMVGITEDADGVTLFTDNSEVE